MAKAHNNTCAHCGEPLQQNTGRGRPRKFCSTSCLQKSYKDRYQKTPVVVPPKKCENCGKEYTTTRSNYSRARYCSDECSSQSRAKTFQCVVCGNEFKQKRNTRGKYCGLSCYRKDQSRLQREKNTHKALKKNPWSPVEWRGCYVCGKELGPRPGQSSFCQSCKDALGSAANSADGKGYSREFLRDRISGRTCRVCGELFTPYNDSSTVCSSKCGRQTPEYKAARKEYKQTEAFKRQKRIENRKRRARKYNNGPLDSIDPIDVFDRDGWRCRICGVYTPKSLRGTTEDRAPELDHIVPLAAGGTHTLDNVQCSCRACNSEKGATIYQQDLFISF